MATTASPLFGHDNADVVSADAIATSAGTKDPVTIGLRQRKQAATVDSDAYRADDESGEDDKSKEKVEVMWGKTPSGQVFRVPPTHSFVHTLLHTFTRSSLTRWTTFSLVAQPIVFFLLAGYPSIRSALFLVYFAFWRSAYDFGFAWILRQQSERKYVVRTLREWGWLDVKSESGGDEGREWAKWWKRELEMKMGEGYTWESVPAEYNSWLIFRQLVDIVLLNDFVSYSLFAWANLNFPANQGILTHIFRWVLGWSLIAFNLWVKVDAHRVVKDYAWYWGDAFWLMVMQHDLVFDGVYEIAPHPMYSVGYAGYYGLSIIVGSYTVLFVSLAAHAAQFAFLLWFENPHIDRTYGGAKKPLAARIPLDLGLPASTSSYDDHAAEAVHFAPELSTPAQTEGETETEAELSELPEQEEPLVHIRSPGSTTSSLDHGSMRRRRSRAMSTSIHDLTYQFFRKPMAIFWRFDPFRASDFALVVLVTYAVFSLVPALPRNVGLGAHVLHALVWRLFHSFGLGLLLRAQSKTKWFIRHYLNNYPYPGENGVVHEDEAHAEHSVVKRATEEAFNNWQIAFNISLVMTYVSFVGLAWKMYHLPSDWTVSGTILRHVLGALLVALHVWSAVSTYEVLGDFGWFYSDFFLIEQVPARLAYTGIYRFLNNPERTLGGAAFLGLALISNSKLVFALAVFSHLSHWWFLAFVEGPHMKRLYGDRLRRDGGLTKTVKGLATKTLSTKKSLPELKRYVKEVRGSLEKVEFKVAEAVEELIEQARPRLTEFAKDTKNLIKQSREHMTITRVAKDMSAYDTSRYSITVASSSTAPAPRYHVGQPIRVSWSAPSNHSRKDWIGIYRVGSCKDQLITKISSMGKWVPIFEEEYRGEEQAQLAPEEQVSHGDAGTVTFRGSRLPWAPGQYELRYHHDGKHNVMDIVTPIEIYVSKPSDMHSFRAVHDTLLNIVCLALDSNVSLVPRSARQMASNVARGQPARVRSSSSSSAGTPARAVVTGLGLSAPASRRPSVPADPLDSFGAALASTASNGSYGGIPPPLEPTISEMAAEMETHSHGGTPQSEVLDLDEQLQDEDDFVIMEEHQAKHISRMAQWAFGIDLNPDVVVADANVTALARRILGERNLFDGASPLLES